LVYYIRLVVERAGRAVQVEAVVAANDRLKAVVVVVIVVVAVVIIVVSEREFVVVPLCTQKNTIFSDKFDL